MKRVATVMAMGLAAGCASGPVPFPDARDAVVSVSASTWETGGQYSVPGGQVYVTAQGGMNLATTTGYVVGAVLAGVLGGAAGAQAVDQIRAKSALEGQEAALAVGYETLIAKRLREPGRLVSARTSDSPARVLLVPKAVLVQTSAGAVLMCSLGVQYSVGGTASAFPHRSYTYASPQPRPLVGAGSWTEGNGAVFRAVSEAAFTALTDTFAADWNGQLPPNEKARPVQFQRGAMREPRAGLVLWETGDFLVLPSGSVDSPNRSQLFLLERAAVVR